MALFISLDSFASGACSRQMLIKWHSFTVGSLINFGCTDFGTVVLYHLGFISLPDDKITVPSAS